MVNIILHNFFFWFNILVVITLSTYLFITHKEYVVKEFSIQTIGTIIIIGLSTFLMFSIGTDIIQKEFLGGKVVQFVHDEAYTEEYDCSEERCSTSSNGTRTCRTIKKTCTKRVDDEYYLINSNNSKIDISSTSFKNAAREFNTSTKKVHRQGQTTLSKSLNEGEQIISVPNIFIATAEIHRYSNYLIASEYTIQKSKLHQETIDKYKDFLVNYPELQENRWGEIHVNRILEHNSSISQNTLNEYQKELELLAYKYGKEKQVNPFIYIAKTNDMLFKDALEAYYKKGNKNDSILILGIDDSNKIVWSDSINWSKDKTFEVSMKKDFIDLNINDVKNVISKYDNNLNNNWKRLSMEEEYGYLKEEITIEWYYQLLIIVINSIFNFFVFRYFLTNKNF